MRLLDRLINKTVKTNCNFDRAFLQSKIRESCASVNMGARRLELFNEKDHYMLEISVLLKAISTQDDGNQDIMINKLIAYVRIDNNSARKVGVLLDSPLYTDRAKRLLIDWEKLITNFTDDLNNRVYANTLAANTNTNIPNDKKATNNGGVEQ